MYKIKFSHLIIILSFVLFDPSIIYAYSPKIVAHRGGGVNFPENTVYAFKKALKAGSDLIELDVQLTKDNKVVLYHPTDLSILTEAKGNINSFTYSQLMQLDAAYNFDPKRDKSFPERGKGHKIPLLTDVLTLFPNVVFIIDLKSLPAKDLVDNMIKVIDKNDAWKRVIFYSTNDEHLIYLKQIKPEAELFESRNITRKRLLSLRNEGICCCMDDSSHYVGFELDREMIVEESFKLGKDTNKIHFKLWDSNAINCMQQAKGKQTKIFLFGINNKQDFEEAKKLNAYAVFTDDPVTLIRLENNRLVN